MRRASFLTPIFFFSSIRAGSGKASIVANLSVYLNNLSQKIALIDLDADTPLKLKNSFPQSIALQEYADVSQLAKGEESRFQKNFYFSETSLISYFPAHQLKDPALLLTDTALRDFFIQLKASFDTVIINLPSGPLYCEKISDLLSRKHLWRGSQPVSIIVSQSDDKCLVNLDSLLQKNPALTYQIQENTMLLFNRVPASQEEQNLADSTLNSFELRQLFDLPLSYIIPISEEFPQQRLLASPLVLKTDSFMHQAVSSLNRLLAHAGESPLKEISARNNDFQACLDGDLLEKLTPYLEKIQAAAAARLFIHPSELQVFLEEGSGNFRIRIRLAGVAQPLLGIENRLPLEPQCKVVSRPSPELFDFPEHSETEHRLATVGREVTSTLVFKSIFEFDDNFSCITEKKLHPQIGFFPVKPGCPSPILFRHSQTIAEIPSLSHILGFARQKYRKLTFNYNDQRCKMPGVTHFFIPPEFSLNCTWNCIFPEEFKASRIIGERCRISHFGEFSLAYEWPEIRCSDAPELPDAFARNKPFVMENDYLLRGNFAAYQELSTTSVSTRAFAPCSLIEISPCRFSHYERLKVSSPHYLTPPSFTLCLPSVTHPEENLTESITAKIKDLAAPAEFAVNLASELAAFREHQITTSRMPLEQSLYFPLPETTAQKRLTNSGLIQVLTGNVSSSPACFCTDETLTFAAHDFLAHDESKLPSRFSWEDLLLDYVYQSCKKIPPPRACYSCESITPVDFRPQLKLFFKQSFPAYEAVQLSSEIVFTPKPMAQYFKAFSTDLKNIAFAVISSRQATSGEILHVKARVQLERQFKDYAGSQVYRTDCVTDSTLNRRNWPAEKGRMLKAGFQTGEHPGVTAGSPIKEVLPGHSEFSMKPAVLLHRNPQTARIKQDPDFLAIPVDIFKNYQPLPGKPPVGSFHQTLIGKTAVRSAFNIDEIELCTLALRQEYRRFHNFSGVEIATNINLMPQTIKKSFRLMSIGVNSYSYSLVHDSIEIPTVLPMRNRKPELPGCEKQCPQKLALRIDTIMDAIIWQSGEIQPPPAEKIVRIKKCLPELDIQDRFPLTISAAKTTRRLAQRKITFFARFPTPLEVLYQHLLWQLNDERAAGFEISSTSVHSKKAEDFGEFTISGGPARRRSVEFSEKPGGPGSTMKQRTAREQYAIANLRLRDLMNLARQTNQKFTEITNKMRA